MINWTEEEPSIRYFEIDRTFNRTIFRFHHFSVSERLRIVQYPDTIEPTRFLTIREENDILEELGI